MQVLPSKAEESAPKLLRAEKHSLSAKNLSAKNTGGAK